MLWQTDMQWQICDLCQGVFPELITNLISIGRSLIPCFVQYFSFVDYGLIYFTHCNRVPYAL